AEVVAALREQVVYRGGDDLRAVEVEQLQRARDERAHVAAVLEPQAHELVGLRDVGAETVTPFSVTRAGLLPDDGPAVRRVLDGGVLRPRARVRGDDAIAVEQ